MAAGVVEKASVSVPLLGSHLDENGMAESAEIAGTVSDALVGLHTAVLALRPRRNTVYPCDFNQRVDYS